MTALIRNHLLFLLFLLHIGWCSAQAISDKKDVPIVQKDSIQVKVDTLVKIVWNHYTQKNYAETIKVGEEVIALAIEIDDYKNIIEVSSLIGNSFLHIEDTLQAKRVFSKSLEIANKRRDSSNILATTIDMGNFYALQKEWKPAIVQYKQALPFAKKLNDTIYLFIITYNLADVNLELNNLGEAELYIDQTKIYGANLKWPTYHAATALLIGKYFVLKKNPAQAIPQLVKSIKISEKENDVEGLIEAYEYYAKAEALQGNYQRAYDLREKYDFYKNEKYKIDKIAAIETVTAKFKVNQYEQELKAVELQSEFNKQEARKQTTLVWAAIAASILIIFLFFALNSNRKIKKLLIDLTQKNKQYLEAKEKSEELTKAKSTMFSTISHELRTPIYGIIGISSLLKEDKSLNNHSENIKSLNFSAEYLLALINNILHLNNLDSPHFIKLKEESFNIRKLVEKILKSSEFIRADNQNKMEILIGNDVPKYIIGDHVRLSQVLINLVGNSTKFTKNGVVRVEILKKKVKGNSICLQFTIKDSGSGISAERQKIIFNEFSHTNDRGEYKGTGLGLPIVKKILDLHDSDIELKSGVEQGTEVKFAIWYKVPIKQTEDIPNLLLTEELFLKGKHILVVDDNKINLIVTQKSLLKLGITSLAANSGTEAITMVRDGKFDLILMDIHMPEMNGFEATEAIRKFNGNIPIIALTAVEIENIKDDIESSGMNDFIIKPYNYTHFVKILYKHLVNNTGI